MRQHGREVRQLLNNRRFPRTYFSTEKGSEGEMVISGKEVITEVSTSVAFYPTIQQSISPLNDLLFPKLSAIASAFEQYRFRKLRFHYVTGCPATTSGSIMHYVDYDLADAPAPTAIALLANQTASVASVALDNSIDYDVNRQMLPKMFTGANQAVAVGSARESFIGFYRLFMDKGTTPTPTFAGYVYVEYVCSLWTPKPPTPIGGTATTSSASQTLVASSVTRFPLPVVLDQGGLPGQPATSPGAAYVNAGGIVGIADFARNVYQAGKWLLEAYGSLSAATTEHDEEHFDARSHRSLISLRSDFKSVGEDPLERKEAQVSLKRVFARGKCRLLPDDHKISDDPAPTVWSGNVVIDMNLPIDHPRSPMNPKNRRAPLVSGDVTWVIQWYDVTNGYINPDFPVDTTGMTGVASSSVLYSNGTGALGASLATPMVVPDGKRYVASLRCDLGATTGRTLTGLVFGSTASGVVDI